MTSKNALYTELLVMRFRRGDASALDELVGMWERPLYYYVRRLVGDEDISRHVMQDSWLKIVRGLGKLREPKSFAAWAYTIARAAAMDHIRDEYARAEQQMDDGFDVADDATDPVIAMDDAEQVHMSLAKLSLKHREILTLFFLEDLSMGEIAAMLEISEGTVKSRLHYAKKEMRRQVDRRQ